MVPDRQKGGRTDGRSELMDGQTTPKLYPPTLSGEKNRKFAGEFKTRTMADTTSLSSTPLLEPELSTPSSNLNKKMNRNFQLTIQFNM